MGIPLTSNIVDRDGVGYGPCLRCGKVGTLHPGRQWGLPTYCGVCAKIRRPRAMRAKNERTRTLGELARRGVDVQRYRARGGKYAKG
jgi:hypothetical protein